MIRYISLFSGIGAFEKALDNLGIPYELLAYCEVDKYASKAYSLLHHVPESMNLGDITKVDEKALPTDMQNQEFDLYRNNAALYNKAYSDYASYYNRKIMPASEAKFNAWGVR